MILSARCDRPPPTRRPQRRVGVGEKEEENHLRKEENHLRKEENHLRKEENLDEDK